MWRPVYVPSKVNLPKTVRNAGGELGLQPLPKGYRGGGGGGFPGLGQAWER